MGHLTSQPTVLKNTVMYWKDASHNTLEYLYWRDACLNTFDYCIGEMHLVIHYSTVHVQRTVVE